MASITEVYRELVEDISGIEKAMQPGELARVRNMAMGHGLSEEMCREIEGEIISDLKTEKLRIDIMRQIGDVYATPSNQSIERRLMPLRKQAEANGLNFDAIHAEIFRVMRAG